MDMIKTAQNLAVLVTLCLSVISFSLFPAEGKSFKEEEEELKIFLGKNPKDQVSVTRLGEIYWGTGRKKAAIKEFRKAIKIDPDYPVPYYFLGQAYFLERKPEKATENFHLLMDKMDNLGYAGDKAYYISILHKTGASFWAMKMYADAYTALERILKLDSDDTKARYNLGVYYYNHLRDRNKAFNEMRKVIELEPESRIAAKAEFFIDYMRRNPDPRIIGDFTFIDEQD